jgi:hypothetical protein
MDQYCVVKQKEVYGFSGPYALRRHEFVGEAKLTLFLVLLCPVFNFFPVGEMHTKDG